MNSPQRVIVIEDDFLLSETLKDALAKLGCAVQAQAGSVDDGMRIVATTPCDFAVVDINLKGEMAFAVLDELQDRGIPFLMATGTFADELPPRHAGAARLSKPYDLHALRRAIDALTGLPRPT